MQRRLKWSLGTAGLAAAIAIFLGCAGASVRRAPAKIDCPLIAVFDDEAAMEAALPALWKEHKRELIVIGTGVYVNS
ncbi:MAG: hypothetical protein ACYTGX_18385 [Planctomycetota bacterium]|jgi:hypothetical protein